MNLNPEFESSENIELDKDPEKACKQIADILDKKYKEKFGAKNEINMGELFSSTIDELKKVDLPAPFEITDTEIDEETGHIDFTIKGPAEWIDMMRPIVEQCNAEEQKRREDTEK